MARFKTFVDGSFIFPSDLNSIQDAYDTLDTAQDARLDTLETLVAGNLAAANIAADAIGSSELADNAVDTAAIAAAAVTPAKHAAAPYCQLYLTDVFIAHAAGPITLGDSGGGGSSWNEEYDTDGMRDAVVTPWKVTMQRAGLYLVTLTPSWDNNGTGTTGQLKHTIALGGGALGGGATQVVDNSNPTGGILHLPTIQTLVRAPAAGAWVCATAYQSTGADRSLSSFANAGTRFRVAWIAGI